MEWIDVELDYPCLDRILCYGDNQVFIYESVETQFGTFYNSTDWRHAEIQNMPKWTHWMPLPEPPKELND